MTKKLIDINDDLLDQAKGVLGTSTIKDTVHRALDDVVRRQRRRDYARLLANGEHNLNDPEVMAGAWPEPMAGASLQ